MISLEKKSLLITIKCFHSKMESLPVNKRKWFNHTKQDYQQITVPNDYSNQIKGKYLQKITNFFRVEK